MWAERAANVFRYFKLREAALPLKKPFAYN